MKEFIVPSPLPPRPERLRKICWIDSETTGLIPKKHGIIQLSALLEIDGEIAETVDLFANPQKEIDPGAVRTNGYTAEKLVSFPSSQSMYLIARSSFEKFIDNRWDKKDKWTFAGYNIGFDIPFVEALWEENQDPSLYNFFSHFPFDVLRFVTICEWCGSISRPLKYSLENVARHLGLEIPVGLHNSLTDIQLTRTVAIELRKRLLTLRLPRRRLIE